MCLPIPFSTAALVNFHPPFRIQGRKRLTNQGGCYESPCQQTSTDNQVCKTNTPSALIIDPRASTTVPCSLTIIHTHLPQNIQPREQTKGNDKKGQDCKRNGDSSYHWALRFFHAGYHGDNLLMKDRYYVQCSAFYLQYQWPKCFLLILARKKTNSHSSFAEWASTQRTSTV